MHECFLSARVGTGAFLDMIIPVNRLMEQNFATRPNVRILPWRRVRRALGRLRARGCGHGGVASASDMLPTDPPIARLRGGSRGLVLVGRSLGGGGWAGSRGRCAAASPQPACLG